MKKEDKKKYHLFEDRLHQRLEHRPLEERSESAEVLDLSKELVQDTNWIRDQLDQRNRKKDSNNNAAAKRSTS